MNDREQIFLNRVSDALSLDAGQSIKMSTILSEQIFWDSLAYISISIMLELDYGKVISFKEINSCTTISDLYNLAGEHA